MHRHSRSKRSGRIRWRDARVNVSMEREKPAGGEADKFFGYRRFIKPGKRFLNRGVARRRRRRVPSDEDVEVDDVDDH